MKEVILNINNLNVSYGKKNILNDFNLKIKYGETHIIMGPNGAGKSTLAKILTGYFKDYSISGDIFFEDKNLLNLKIEDIALLGIFLSFQNPIEINGLTNIDFFKAIINEQRKKNGMTPIEKIDFENLIKSITKNLNLNNEMLNRFVNYGFSGGEKKRNELFQMLLLNPKLIILDEIDSGLDLDSLKLVFDILKNFKNNQKALVIITHYSNILNYIDIDFLHILKNGKIIKSGKNEIIDLLEKNGYDYFD